MNIVQRAMEEEFRDRVALTTAEYGEHVDTAFRVSVKKDITVGYNGVRSPKFIWAPCHVMCTAVLTG